MAKTSATLNSYLHQWTEYFHTELSETELLKSLQNFAFDGKLRSCKFRSVCWRIFLRSLPGDIKLWGASIEKSRQNYLDVKHKHITIPSHEAEEKDLAVENPLSQNDQSSWMKFFKNGELRKTIERDVKRTFPEMEYFHNESVHELLVNVLFCYAQEHSDLSYRQGMHELLAPLVFIIHCDLQAAAHAREIGALTDLINLILKEEFLEHDAYDMFCHLMVSTNAWYCVTEKGKNEEMHEYGVSENSQSTRMTENRTMPTRPFQPQEIATSGGPTLAITNKLNHIHNTLLVQHDLQLHTHLNRLEIIPQVFGLRWIRLLFGREFSLQDLLVLWDAVFADSSRLDLVDYLFVAMLIHIRHYLLNADYSSCMQILMKYPPVDDINDIVQAAKEIRMLKEKSFSDSLVEVQNASSVNNKILKNNARRRNVPSTQRSNSYSQNPISRLFKDITKKVTPENKSNPQHSHLNDPTYAGNMKSPAQTKNSNSNKWNVTGNRIRIAPRAEEMNGKSPTQLEEEVVFLHHELERMKQMCLYCSDKIDASVTVLQSSVNLSPPDDDSQSTNSLQNDVMAGDASNADEQEKFEKEQILVTVAGLKQIRDLLRGSLTFNPNLREYKTRVKNTGGEQTVQNGVEISTTPQTNSSTGEVEGT